MDSSNMEKINEAQRKWHEGMLREYLEKYPERKKSFASLEGAYTLRNVYTPLNLEEQGIDYLSDIGFPGQFPYTRGIEPNMYRSRLWEIAQYVGLGTSEAMNERLKFLVSQGLSGVTIALDLPTQLGYDADHPLAHKEVGKVGVAVSSLQDMEGIFDGIPLGSLTSVRTTGVCIAPIWAAFMLALCEKQGIRASDVCVVTQNDPLREIVARGTQIFPINPSVRFTTDLIEFCAKNLPTWFPLQIADYHYKQMGAPPVDALAFSLCTAIEYIRNTMERGLGIDHIAPLIEFSFAIDTEFLEGIARFRAARKLWAKIIKERFGAKNSESCMMRNNAYGYGFPLTAQEPMNNIIRIAIEALALALAGPQAMNLPSYDEARSIPGPEPAKIALRTQQIIAYETGVTDVVDPLGGSYYIESATNEIEKQATAVVSKVDEMGGAAAAITEGYYDRIINQGAYEYQKAIESGDRTIVAVNKFQSEEKVSQKAFRVDPALEAEQCAKLRELRRQRNNRAVTRSLGYLRDAASRDQNLILPILDAVKEYATLGEICDVLRDVWGEWTRKTTVLS